MFQTEPVHEIVDPLLDARNAALKVFGVTGLVFGLGYILSQTIWKEESEALVDFLTHEQNFKDKAQYQAYLYALDIDFNKRALTYEESESWAKFHVSQLGIEERLKDQVRILDATTSALHFFPQEYLLHSNRHTHIDIFPCRITDNDNNNYSYVLQSELGESTLIAVNPDIEDDDHTLRNTVITSLIHHLISQNPKEAEAFVHAFDIPGQEPWSIYAAVSETTAALTGNTLSISTAKQTEMARFLGTVTRQYPNSDPSELIAKYQKLFQSNILPFNPEKTAMDIFNWESSFSPS